LHCSPLRNCIRQKTADGEWHSFVCPFDHLSVLFIRTLMSRAIKLNSGLKCFSCTKLKVSLERGQSKSPLFGYISAGQERHHHHLHKPSYFVHPSVDPSVSQSVSQSIIRIVFVCVSFSIPINLFGIFGCQFFPLFTPPHFFWPANTFCLLLSICAANQKQKVFDVACCIFK